MKTVFAGSFDPFTIGHLSIVERAVKLFGKVVVAVGYNEHKPGMWTAEQRVEAISRLFEGNPDVEVTSYQGLTATFARGQGADALLRGVRSVSDFEYERNLADTNREVFGVETVFLLAEPKTAFVSSSMVRELIHNGYDPSEYIAGDFPTKLLPPVSVL